MLWWIVAGLVGLAVALLAGGIMSVMGRLHALRRAQRRMTLRGRQAERLAVKVAALQERAAALPRADNRT